MKPRISDRPVKCRLCGTLARRRTKQTYGNVREFWRHKCPHGVACPTGMRGLTAQTLTAKCDSCRAATQGRP